MLTTLVQESTMRMQPAYRNMFERTFITPRPLPARASESDRARPASHPFM
jgi:hypothetical protein